MLSFMEIQLHLTFLLKRTQTHNSLVFKNPKENAVAFATPATKDVSISVSTATY